MIFQVTKYKNDKLHNLRFNTPVSELFNINPKTSYSRHQQLSISTNLLYGILILP